MKTSFSSISFIFFLLCIAGGDAHMRLTNPVPRSSSDNLTSGPCGGVAAKTPIQFTQNDALNVGIDSTSGHSGTLTVNLLTSAGTQVKQLTSKSANGASGYTLSVVLDTVCNNCILQAKLASSTTWYSCADITVKSNVVIIDEDEEHVHNEDSDVIDENSELDDDSGDDNNQSQLSKEKRDVLVQYISIIAASIVVIFVCVSLLVCNRNRRRRQAQRLHNS